MESVSLKEPDLLGGQWVVECAGNRACYWG